MFPFTLDLLLLMSHLSTDSFQTKVNELLGVCSRKVPGISFQWNIANVGCNDPEGTIARKQTVFNVAHKEVHVKNSFNNILETYLRTQECNPCPMALLHLLPFKKPIRKSERRKFQFTRTVKIAGNAVNLPKSWNPIQSHSCSLFDVEASSQEYKAIAEDFKITMDAANIVKIVRIQNLTLFQKYSHSLQRVGNEHFLYHGTRATPPDRIYSSQEGFDVRLSGCQNLWGQGIYFTEDADYTDRYAYNTLSGTKKVIVSSVAIGNSFDFGTRTEPGLTKPPLDFQRRKYHDSVTGITDGTKVFSIYSSQQSCPRYIIEYKNNLNQGSNTLLESNSI